jgi:hypothetical protein
VTERSQPRSVSDECAVCSLQGIAGHGFYDDCVVPIIENTARECELTDRLQVGLGFRAGISIWVCGSHVSALVKATLWMAAMLPLGGHCGVVQLHPQRLSFIDCSISSQGAA